MTNLAQQDLSPSSSFGDILTTTNMGAGLSVILKPLQDGFGTNSSVTIASNAINFSTQGGNSLQINGVALTASAANLNSLAQTTGNVLIVDTVGTPATPVGGGVLFVNAGALKYIGSSGTVTTIAVA